MLAEGLWQATDLFLKDHPILRILSQTPVRDQWTTTSQVCESGWGTAASWGSPLV